jgi:excisionase family DNA binding protein
MTSAHDKVYRMIERGKLTRPDRCEWCGKKCKPVGHHEDLSKPLEVMWICHSCHGRHHNLRVREEVYDKMNRSSRRTKRLLSTNRVADICEVSPRTVAKWLRDGELTGVKINSRIWRVEEDELERFVDGRRVKP